MIGRSCGPSPFGPVGAWPAIALPLDGLLGSFADLVEDDANISLANPEVLGLLDPDDLGLRHALEPLAGLGRPQVVIQFRHQRDHGAAVGAPRVEIGVRRAAKRPRLRASLGPSSSNALRL
jgi:hypothetical protein